MNKYQERIYGLESVETTMCAICKCRRATNRHHIVPRSQGGTKGCTITLCGMGNASGCHGLAHQHRLHFREHNGKLEYLLTNEAMKDYQAYNLEGWRIVTPDR